MRVTINHKLNGSTVGSTSHRVTSATGLIRCLNRTRQSGTHGGCRISRNVVTLPGVTELEGDAIQLPTGSLYLLF